MKSKWYELKSKAIKLRQVGLSLGVIGAKLKIPKSTLSGWFRNIILSKEYKNVLIRNWKNGLIKARKKAVVWHKQQKIKRIEEAKTLSNSVFNKINLKDKYIQELALAMLYLGEGNKGNHLGLGSSDPRILKFFLRIISNVYSVNLKEVYCSLNLRFDQNKERVIKYWSKSLGLPISCFKTVSFDKRTKGITTYSSYNGVCQIRFGDVSLQRRLIFLAHQYCDSVIDKGD